MQTLIKAGEVINGGVYRATPLEARFDQQIIAPNIKIAELTYVIEVLCKPLYDDLIAEQNANEANYNPNVGAIVEKFPTNAAYETLWTDGGLGMLCARAVYLLCLPYVGIKVGSNGMFTTNIENATNAVDKQLKYMIDAEGKNLKVLQDYVANYLCQNSSSYSLFPATEKCKDVEGCNDCAGVTSESKNTNILTKFGLI